MEEPPTKKVSARLLFAIFLFFVVYNVLFVLSCEVRTVTILLPLSQIWSSLLGCVLRGKVAGDSI